MIGKQNVLKGFIRGRGLNTYHDGDYKILENKFLQDNHIGYRCIFSKSPRIGDFLKNEQEGNEGLNHNIFIEYHKFICLIG